MKNNFYESQEIVCNLESDLDLAQSKIMNYIEKQPEKKTEENLVSLLSKTPIFDPEKIIIFDICSFIKTESDAIKALQDRLWFKLYAVELDQVSLDFGTT